MMFAGGLNHPPLNVILRGPIAKSVQRAPNSVGKQHTGAINVFRPISFITFVVYPRIPLSSTATQLKVS